MFKLLILAVLALVFTLGIGLEEEAYDTGSDTVRIVNNFKRMWEDKGELAEILKKEHAERKIRIEKARNDREKAREKKRREMTSSI